MKTLKIISEIIEYQSIGELSQEEQMLIGHSKESSKKAYAPYSNFNVGAAILLNNNEIITGNNQENHAFPSGLCAERVALFYANAKYPDIPVKTIAICANISLGQFTNDPISPCGACRQVILETENRFQQPIKIILFGEIKIYVLKSIRDIMPLAFGSKLE